MRMTRQGPVLLAVVLLQAMSAFGEEVSAEADSRPRHTVTLNLVPLASWLAARTVWLDVTYARTLSPKVAFHLGPWLAVGDIIGFGIETGVRYHPYQPAHRGLYAGAKLVGFYGFSDYDSGAASRVHANIYFQLGYTLIFSPALEDPLQSARSGFLLEAGIDVGGGINVAWSSIGAGGGPGPAVGIRLAIGYAF